MIGNGADSWLWTEDPIPTEVELRPYKPKPLRDYRGRFARVGDLPFTEEQIVRESVQHIVDNKSVRV